MKLIFRPIYCGLLYILATAPNSLAEILTDADKSEIATMRQQIQDLTRMVHELQQQAADTARPSTLKPPGNPPPAISSTEPPTLQADTLAGINRPSPSLFNPEISAAIDAIGSYSSSTDNANFTIRDIELMVQSNVDQLARAYVVFNAESELDPWTKTDTFSDVSLGVEEAAIETTGLPAGLVLKAGQFFADFTRLGKIHSHELPFTDRPSSLDGIIGGETKSRGLELNWLLPLNQYVRLTFGAVDQIGAETAATGVYDNLDLGEQALFAGSDHRSITDLTFYSRAATIFEIGDDVSLNLGIDYAHGQDQGTRQLASADFKLTWIPAATSFDRLEVGGEILQGKNSGDFSSDALVVDQPASGESVANGAYAYAQYRIGKAWEPGIRYDWFRPEVWTQTDGDADGVADGLASTRQAQSSFSAYINYHLSEYSRLRLGATHVNGASGSFNGQDDDWLGFLQWSIIIGAHQHAFQP